MFPGRCKIRKKSVDRNNKHGVNVKDFVLNDSSTHKFVVYN